MHVLLFALHGRNFAIEAGAIDKVTPPDMPAPPGFRLLDLAAVLGLAGGIRGGSGHHAVLSGGRIVVDIGRPLGTTRIEPEWIVPLPSHIFKTPGAPFRGLIEIPEAERRAPRGAAARSLLLDERTLCVMSAPEDGP